MKVRLLAVAFGFFLVTGTAYAGPNPGGADSDGDTVENAFDNCVTASNNVQTDTDHNGCGDVCQASIICDINGDTAVGGGDLAAIGMNFGMTGCTPVTCGARLQRRHRGRRRRPRHHRHGVRQRVRAVGHHERTV